MNIDDAFPGKYLKCGNLKGKRHQVVIEQITMEEVGGETKPILHFTGREMGLCLNKTNALTIAAVYGTEMDNFIGKTIIIKPDKTPYQGKIVDCIRVEVPELAAEGSTEEIPPGTDPNEEEPPF